MRMDARRLELLQALGHRPLRLAAREPQPVPAPIDPVLPVQSSAAPLPADTRAGSPLLMRALARAGRMPPAAVPAWLAGQAIDPATAAGKRALWPLLRAARTRRT